MAIAESRSSSDKAILSIDRDFSFRLGTAILPVVLRSAQCIYLLSPCSYGP